MKASERERKLHSQGVRLTQDDRARLEAAASMSGHSMTREIERRLEASFALDAAAENERLIEALIWCSAAPAFQEGGEAREGWLKLCKPLIDAHCARRQQ